MAKSAPSHHYDLLRRRMGRVGAWLNTLGTLSATGERAHVNRIEGLGYSALWIGEGPGNKEAFAHAGILLAASEHLVVATAIASIWARDATAMKLGALALADAYPGRFALGMGVSHATLVAARGHRYQRPLSVMRAYLDEMDGVEYGPPAPAEPPVRLLGALRPRMLGLARDRADGAHTYLVPVQHTVAARELLGPEPVLVPEQAVLLDVDPSSARAKARAHLSPYLRLPNYLKHLRDLGFDADDLADGGSDRLVDALVAWGSADEIRERIAGHLAAGADHVAIQPLASDIGGALDQLEALAPSLLAP